MLVSAPRVTGAAESAHSEHRDGRHDDARHTIGDMPTPSLALSPTRPEVADGDVLVLFVQAGADGPTVIGRDVDRTLLSQVRASGATDQVVRLPAGLVDEGPVMLTGVGSAPTETALRSAAGAAVRASGGDVRLILDALPAGPEQLAALLEGAALGGYIYPGSPRSGGQETPASSVVVLGDAANADALVRHAQAVGDAVALTRRLVDTPPSQQGPADLARAASTAVSDLPIDVREWDEAALHADGFGGILGVGKGSVRPPRLVRLDYAPTGAQRHLALVGKGITFDSGGLSLKPPASMVGMKYDMAGAASVLAVVVAAARLGLPVRVTAWMCIAENLPSGSAIRPNDVLTIRGGTRVEVLNTDAEGRLVLADGLRAALEEKPDLVIDIATLTGAQIVALGTRYSAVMGDDEAVSTVRNAAEHVGELVWPMPLPSELRSRLNSEVADLANATPGNRSAGMLLAGVFLREFVSAGPDSPDAPAVPWAHLDIAGTAQNNGSPYGFTGKGATGVLVRTLIRVAEEFGAR
jgi:leucyl aminopeptidase